MIRAKFAGGHDAVRSLIAAIAAQAFGTAIDPAALTGPIASLTLDTVRLSVLFAPAVAGDPGGADADTGLVRPPRKARPAGADILVTLHGTPTEGEHLAVVAAALPAVGETVAGVTRLPDDGALGIGWG